MSRLLKSIFGAGSDYDTHAPYKYPEFDRTPEDAPRYTPNDDGWWRRPDAEGTNEAVLCCVGDLMGEPKLQSANKYGDSFFFIKKQIVFAIVFHGIFDVLETHLRIS